MAIKTLFIAPYPAMTSLIEECGREEQELNIQIEVGDLQEAIPLAKQGEAQGVDVIISRGGTAKLIEQVVDVPVIDVHVSGYDMLRVLTLANDFPGKKAIVGFSNITLGAKAITDLLDISIEVFTVEEAAEVEPLIKQLKSNGFKVIIGDVVTVNTASRFCLESILIQSGREAIFEAFHKVKSVYRLHRRKTWEIKLLHSLLQESMSMSDIIVLNDKGQIVYQQWEHFDSCPISLADLVSSIGQEQLDETVTMVLNKKQKHVKQKLLKKIVDGIPCFLFSFSEFKHPTQQVELQAKAIAHLPMLIHQSKKMNNCLSYIETNKTASQWVLIGEEGTGKGLISRYIHHKKHDGKGLYANITAMKALKLKEINDHDICTICINKIDLLPPSEMNKFVSLLDAWQEKGFTIILSLREEIVSLHAFIFDDETIRVAIPPLRNRKEDIRPLITYFVASFHRQLGTSAIKIKEEAVVLLEQYSWPGNVAELKTLLKDAVVEEKGYVIEKDMIEQLLERKKKDKAVKDNDFLTGTLEEIEKRIIKQVMEEENHHQTKAAERLGINRSTLWRKLKQ